MIAGRASSVSRVYCRRKGAAANRWLVFSLLCLLMVSWGQLLTGCSTPTRAKVVSKESASAQEKQRRTTSSRPGRYRVRKGDTLYSIAWRYGLDFRTLAAWNRVRYPYVIYPGQILRFSKPPVSSPSAAAPPQKTTSIKRPPRANGSLSSQKKPHRSGSKTVNTSGSKKGAVEQKRKLRWQWPAKGRLKQGFVKGDPTRKGIEIAGHVGQPVLAAEAGKVVYAGSGLIGYGRLVIIKHNKNYLSAYGHNRKLRVEEGASVKRGQVLAEMGRNSGGETVLHFEIRRNGSPVNPLKLLP